MSDTPQIVTSYHVEIRADRALLTLESTETPNLMGGTRIAMAEYSSEATPSELITRGGFLSMKRPIELFAPTLDLLRNETPVYLHSDGTVATVAESVGEGEDEGAGETPADAPEDR
jgi:hypothetical protein